MTKPDDEFGSFQFTTSTDAKRAEYMFNRLASERDSLIAALCDIRDELMQSNGGKGPSSALTAHILELVNAVLAKADPQARDDA